MKKLICLILASTAATFGYASDSATPVGYWKTIDDVSGKPKSIIQIWQSADNTLSGKVIKIFPKVGEDQNKLCDACKGDKHNQRIVSMVILDGLKNGGAKWDSGKILDPENGKTYSCNLKVADAGKKLEVHGFIGLPIIGRTQTWERVDKITG